MGKKDFRDDGRQIADMSGLEHTGISSSYKIHRKRKQDASLCDNEEIKSPEYRAETRAMLFSAMFAALAVAGIFLAAGALFILFCTKIWFR
jgi:hypothetical protein